MKVGGMDSQPKLREPRLANAFQSSWRRSLYVGVFAFAVVVVAAIFWARDEQRGAVRDWKARLGAMADDRRDAIDVWLEGRHIDAELLAADPEAGARLAPAMVARRGYVAAYLLDSSGQPVTAAGPLAGDPHLVQEVAATRGDEPPHLIVTTTGARVLVVTAPVPVTAGAPSLRASVLVADPAPWVYSLLHSEPMATDSGEALLWVWDGSDLVSLSPVRFLTTPPSGLRRRADSPDFAAARAFTVKAGFGEFRDYRGVPILAATRRLENAPWALVVKVDRREALAEVPRRLSYLALLVGAIAAAIAAIVYAASRREMALRVAAAEGRAVLLNRLLLTRSAVNRLVVTERNANHLLAYACRAAVEEGGFPIAWIAQAEPSGDLRPVAAHGLLTVEELATAPLRWSEGPLSLGPAGTAVREHRTLAVSDLSVALGSSLWGRLGDRQALRSAAATPLLLSDGTAGVLVLCAREPGSFDGPNLAMLDETGQDLSHAFEAIEARERRDAAEEEARKLSRAVDHSPASVVITDASGQIEYVNAKFTEVSGYTLDEVRGENPRVLKSGLVPTETYQQMWSTLGQGHEWSGELVNRRKDGALFWEHVAISPLLDATGRTTHYVAVKEDITEARRAAATLEETRQQLLQSQKMEAVGRLAGGVAHDFNNLLTVISGYGELLATTLGPDHPGRAQLEEVLSAADRAAGLTRQLLAFSRSGTSDPRPVDLNALLAGLEAMLHRLIGEDIAVVVRRSTTSCVVRVDPNQMEMVVMNLAVNARDAMPSGGRLVLETAHHELSGDSLEGRGADLPSGSYVTLTATDTGTGMTPEVMDHIFEPFFTTKPQGHGTGLGLATVYGVVEESGGRTEVRSTPGKGATFRIILPRLDEPAGPLEPAEADGESRSGTETILLAEDQQAVRALAGRFLSDLGYTVIAAPDGPAALKIARSRLDDIDLLVTDVVMPGMGGPELATRLQALRPNLPVVFLTGYSADLAARPNLAALQGPLVPKPFDRHELSSAVRRALDSPG